MTDTRYVSQNKLQAGDDYTIQVITATDSWQAVVVSGDYRSISIIARGGNDPDVYTYLASPVQFQFAKTNTPGDHWAALYGINIPLVKDSGETVGYVKGAVGTYITVIGVN